MSDQKKCLLIDQYSSIGGGQTVFLNVIRVCLQSGFSVTALFPHGGELQRRIKVEFAGQIETMDLKELNLTRGRKNLIDFAKSFFFLIYFLRFFRLLKLQDFVYVNGPRLFPAILFCSHFLKCRFIYHLHLEHTSTEKRLIRTIAGQAATHRVIANSDFLYKQLCDFDQNLAGNPKLIVIENALSPHLSCLSFSNRFENMDAFKIITFGRISYEKGQDLIVDAALQHPDWSFFLAGEADFAFEQELRKRAPANLTFLGQIHDPAQTAADFHIQISVVPSRVPESFGMVAIESMAASCLTVVSTQGELLNLAARTSALRFESPAQLETTFQDLHARRPDELTQIALEQFNKTKEHYSFDSFAQKMKEVFQ